MFPSPPIPNSHRIGRLTRLAMLWCARIGWIVLVLMAFAPARDKRNILLSLARAVSVLVYLRTPSPAPSRRRRAHASWRGPARLASLRRTTGARLRRAMRGKDALARLRAIYAVLHDLDPHVAKLARRLRHGLTSTSARVRAEPRAPALQPQSRAVARAFALDSS